MGIENHRIEGVRFEITANLGGEIKPEYLVIHYTVVTTAAATVAAFKNPAVRASAHLVLDLDGTFIQMVPFNRKAWHAGKSSWAGRDGCNDFTIGIEVVNPGPLNKRGSGYVDVNNRAWHGEVVKARHKNGRAPWDYWAAYDPRQLDALREVGPSLVVAYGLKDVVGHDDIAPSRKTDPGPAFPLASVRASLLGRDEDGPEDTGTDRYVTTTILNVRKGPAVSFDTVVGSPLAKGREVEILAEDGAWRHVVTADASVEGWAHGRFLVRA
jgi:N-acetylmuramoyl-L-alanine amidase